MVYSKVFLLVLLMYNQQYQKALRYLNFHHPWRRRRCQQKLKMKLWNVSFFNKQENKPNLLVNPHDNKNVETGETASQGSFTMSHDKEWVRLFWIEIFFCQSLNNQAILEFCLFRLGVMWYVFFAYVHAKVLRYFKYRFLLSLLLECYDSRKDQKNQFMSFLRYDACCI